MSDQELASLFPKEVEGLPALSRRYLEARLALAQAEEVRKRAVEALGLAEAEIIQAMEQAGVSSLRLDGADTVTRSVRTFYQLPAGSLDDPRVRRWFYRQKARDLIKRQVNQQSFSKLCRERHESGKRIPDFVKVAEKKTLSLRAS